jgi:curved DNA-binding protein CbpA
VACFCQGASLLDDSTHDYYETLQVSVNAEPETIHRVYRHFAKHFHPDNQHTGNASRFRLIHEAYSVLRDPEQRAQYDIAHQQQRQTRWRLESSVAESENNFEMERIVRIRMLEVLYAQRRLEPARPGIFVNDLEDVIGRAREHLEFTTWFLVQKKLVQRGDNSQLLITADGVDYLEQQDLANLQMRRLNPTCPS